MPISSEDNKIAHAGDGVSTVFAYPYLFHQNSDLQVRKRVIATGVETPVTPTAFAGAGNPSGGTVTVSPAPAVSEQLWIYRDPPATQTTDYEENDPFPAKSHEAALDKLTMLVQRLRERQDRTLIAKETDAALNALPSSVDRANKVLAFDSNGQPTPSAAPSGTAVAVLADLISASPALGDALMTVKTFLTQAVAMTVDSWINKRVVHLADVGCAADGATDDRAKIQSVIDDVAAAGGGYILAERGKTYRVVAGTSLHGNTAAIVHKDNVKFLLQGATFNCECGTGNQVAWWIAGSNVEIDGGGGLIHCVSSGSPSSQYFFHAGISIGIHNNSGDSVASPNPLHSIKRIRVHSVRVSTSRDFAPAVQVMGGASDGELDIEVPSSANCSCAHLDWSNVGTVSSSAIATTRASFDANQAYTTHPHNWVIRVKAGTMSKSISGDLGANGVRLSACYNILVESIDVESVTLAGFLCTGGDLGFEFARAEDKRHALKNIVCRRLSIRNAATALLQGALIDTLADNIYREQFLAAYVPLINPLMHGNVVLEDCDLVGANQANTYGVRIIQARGVRVRRNSVQRFDLGILVDEFTQDVDVDDNDVFENRADGIKVGVQALREDTERASVRRNRCYANGTAGTGYGINVQRCRSGWIDDNILGTIDEASQDIGILVADNGVNWNVNGRRNHTLGATSTAYSIGGSVGPYFLNQLGEWASNTAELSCPQPIVTAQAQVPQRSLMQVSRWAKEYINNNAGAPSAGIWYAGSRLFQRTPTPSNPAIAEVTTSGHAAGTLSGLTNGATTNGSTGITCSLSARTATASANTYVLALSSVTDIRVGQPISVAGGAQNARVLGISGSDVQINKPTAAVSGAAVTCSGLVEGEVVSLNTTPAIAGAVVMKINGNAVTLDTAAGSTESGRTLSYTAAVFKNHGNIAA